MARKKDVSSVVSGAGLLTSVFTKLDQQARLLGATDQDWHRLSTPDGEETIKQMARAMVGKSDVAPLETAESYQLTVDYDRSLAEMISAGRYDTVNCHITDKHFPIKSSGTLVVEMALVHLGRLITTEEVEAEFDRYGFRPARLEELLAFGEQIFDSQKQYQVVALGSFWVRSDGFYLMPYLWYVAGGYRQLSLSWGYFDSQWSADYHFLAVRK